MQGEQVSLPKILKQQFSFGAGLIISAEEET